MARLALAQKQAPKRGLQTCERRPAACFPPLVQPVEVRSVKRPRLVDRGKALRVQSRAMKNVQPPTSASEMDACSWVRKEQVRPCSDTIELETLQAQGTSASM